MADGRRTVEKQAVAKRSGLLERYQQGYLRPLKKLSS